MSSIYLSYDELNEYVKKTGLTGRYSGYYIGGFLEGRECSVLYETINSSICNHFISPYMRFKVDILKKG